MLFVGQLIFQSLLQMWASRPKAMISELVELGMPGKVENFLAKNAIPWTLMVTWGLRFPADMSKQSWYVLLFFKPMHIHHLHRIYSKIFYI